MLVSAVNRNSNNVVFGTYYSYIAKNAIEGSEKAASKARAKALRAGKSSSEADAAASVARERVINMIPRDERDGFKAERAEEARKAEASRLAEASRPAPPRSFGEKVLDFIGEIYDAQHNHTGNGPNGRWG